MFCQAVVLQLILVVAVISRPQGDSQENGTDDCGCSFATIQENTNDILKKDTQSLPNYLNITVTCGDITHNILMKKNLKSSETVPILNSETLEDIFEDTGANNFANYQSKEPFASLSVKLEEVNGKVKRILEGNVQLGDDCDVAISKMPERNDPGVAAASSGDLGDTYKVEKIDMEMFDINFLPDELKRMREERGGASRRKRQTGTTYAAYSVEIIFLLDHSVWEYWLTTRNNGNLANANSDIRYYYSHLINSLDIIYATIKHQETGYSVDLWLKGIVISQTQAESYYVRNAQLGFTDNSKTGYQQIYVDANQVLEGLKQWQSNNQYSYANPDHIMHFTKYNLYYDSPSVVGFAPVGGICLPGTGTSTQEDVGFNNWLTAAHELGHNLGAYHDGDGNGCSPNDQFIMEAGGGNTNGNPTLVRNAHSFSSCTKNYFRELLDGTSDNYPRVCVTNQVCQHPNGLTNIGTLPGQVYSTDDQCRMFLNTQDTNFFANAVPENDVCWQLPCRSPGTQNSYTWTEFAAADGTDCGGNNWCMMGECVDKTQNPAPGVSTRPSCIENDFPSSVPNGCTDRNPYQFNYNGVNYFNCPDLVTVAPQLCFTRNDVKEDCCKACNERGLVQPTWHLVSDNPINGNWGTWGNYGACTVTCGAGSRTRSRECNNPAPSNGGVTCPGSATETQTCNLANCPSAVNGNWGNWGGWTACSVTCGNGVRTRGRTCDNPAPSNGGATCPGSSTETDNCNQGNCAINGNWGTWTSFGTCSSTCGGGVQGRTRACNNPAPSNGGVTCPGNEEDFQNCNTQACAVNGNWGPWNLWSTCSVTCDSGTRERSRLCNNPAPSGGGATCPGLEAETAVCSTGTSCVVNGNWGEWTDQTSCSVTCGTGTKVRVRQCNNPAPSNGGATCPGSGTTTVTCSLTTCAPVDGNWGQWGVWTDCSVTCGGGERTRTRGCDNPPASNGGAQCPGSGFDTGTCNTQTCTANTNGNWGAWGQWSTCSLTCGGGEQSRQRVCDNPPQSGNGARCPGSSAESRDCNTQTCIADVNGNWGTWGQWSSCSLTCDGGEQFRVRSCDNPAAQGNGAQCPGNWLDVDPCNTQSCTGGPVNGNWGAWGQWTGCSQTCGGGERARSRQCDNPPASNGGIECPGTPVEVGNCNEQSCNPGQNGNWGAWGGWSTCSVTCGTGSQTRNRACDSPPPNGGSFCAGSGTETQNCYQGSCGECDQSQVDLVFVLDSSGSIRDQNPSDGSYDNWTLLKEFVANIVDRLNIGSDATRVGVVTFSDEGINEFYLDTYSSKEDIRNHILGIDYIGSHTNTADGLREMIYTQFTANNGDRSNVDNVAMVITDGVSTIDNDKTLSVAAEAHANGIQVYSLGVTENPEEDELRGISSPPSIKDQNYWMDIDFQGLNDVIDAVVAQTCGTPAPCVAGGDTDIIFVLDSSGSIRDMNPADGSYDNWDLMLDFIVNIIDRLNIGQNDIRVGVVVYSEFSYLRIALNDYYNKADLQNAVRNLAYIGSHTATARGLKTMYEEGLAQSNGARNNVNKVGILISDGIPTIDVDRTMPEAQEAKDRGIKMFAVGITTNINQDILREISSPPQLLNQNYWSTTFIDLTDVVEELVSQTECPGEPVNGNWGSWGEWSTCSVTCAGGIQTRYRSCDDPAPSNGGSNCPGIGEESRSCNTQDCTTCTSSVADIIFILDSSGSIRDQNPSDGSYDNWDLMLEFVVDIIEKLTIGSDQTRIGLIKYSEQVITEFNLNSYTSRSDIIDRVRQTTYMGSYTNTAGGVREALNNGFTSQSGDRSGIQDIMITITDGYPNLNEDDTDDAVNDAVARGIKAFAIGITTQIDESVLKILSSPPQRLNENYWLSPSFTDLDEIVDSVVSGTCGGTGAPPVDGNWGSWNQWSTCTRTCGRGTQSRSRVCNDPAPSNGGRSCDGSETENRDCNTQACDDVCQTYADVAFILDSSGSIRDQNPADGSFDNWEDGVLEFVVSLIERFDIGSDRTRVALVKYSEQVITEFYLNEYTSKTDLINRVRSLDYLGSFTYTAAAIDETANNVFTSANGDRNDRDNIIIIITDGLPNIDEQRTVPAANEAQARGIKMFSIGITDQIDENLLRQLSSQPQRLDENYWTTPDFGKLEDIVDSVVSGTCGTSGPPVDGNWGSWNQWSTCTQTCGRGTQSRSRVCNDPSPSNGGISCDGSGTENRDCNTQACDDVCQTYADVAFILDSSGSIRDQNPADGSFDNWEDGILEFVVSLIERLDIGSDRTRVALVKYSEQVITEFYLNEYSSKTDLINRVRSLDYLGSFTSTAAAIDETANNVFTSANGDRNDRDNIIIIITDGLPNIDEQRTVPAANEAQARGIKMFAIGITDQIDENLLRQLSSQPQRLDENYWTTPDFGKLEDIVDSVVSGTCGTSGPPVDGNWGSWGQFGTCSRTCGGGTQSRSRSCNNPAAANGGQNCPGSSTESQSCNTQTCNDCDPTSVSDIMFILDSSGSIRDQNPADGSYDNWDLCLEFVADVVDKLDIGLNNIRVSLIRYSEFVNIEFRFDAYDDKENLKNKIRSTPYYGSYTFTAGAIREAINFGFVSSNGARSNAARKIIIITDGKPNIDEADTVPAADDAKAAGIDIFAVGITNDVETSLLRDMSSSPQIENENWFQSADFTTLDDIVDELVAQTGNCGGNAVNGNWGGWGGWGSCSVTCGGGSRSRSRSCNNPTPSNGGSSCPGSSNEQESCNSQSCSGPCTDGIDLVFVVDSSGSIRDQNPANGSWDNWALTLDFVSSIVTELDIGSSATRVGLVRYSEFVFSDIYLKDFNNVNDLVAKIQGLPYIGSFTNTADAIQEVIDVQLTSSNGDRNNVPNIIIVITDGNPNLNEDITQQTADNAQNGNTMFAVGVTDAINENTLKGLASQPRVLGQNYWKDVAFNSLNTLVDELLQQACPGSARISWNNWSTWSACSRTCDDGLQERTRTCPLTGQCDGSSTDTRSCNLGFCDVGGCVDRLPECPTNWDKCGTDATITSQCPLTCGFCT